MKYQIRTRSHKLYKTLRRYLDNPARTSRAAFLVGSGRSGTTMVTRHLAKSWQIELFNEDDARAFTKYRLRELNTIETLISASGARVVLFKPILDTHLAAILLSRFENAKMLFSVRHYNDVVNSSLKFGKDNWQRRVNNWIYNDFSEFSAAPPPETTKSRVRSLWHSDLDTESATALYWLFYSSLYYDLGLHQHERVRLVSYEAVVSNSHREFKRLCCFLNLKYMPLMSEGVFSTSIGRDAPPAIAENIQQACECLWIRLRQEKF